LYRAKSRFSQLVDGPPSSEVDTFDAVPAGLAAPPITDPAHITWVAAFLSWVLAVPLYFISKFITVVAHEGGHAAIGTLLFQRVHAVVFDRHGGGGTEFESPPSWPFSIVVAAAGYLGPSMFGLLAAELLVRGMTTVILWGSLGFLLVMLLVVRGLVGWLLVPSLIALIGYVLVDVGAARQMLFVHMWVWFLLIAPVERMLVYLRDSTYLHPQSDTSVLRRATLLPSALWAILLLAGTGAALAFGASLILHLRG
jgi:hypothetical protein